MARAARHQVKHPYAPDTAGRVMVPKDLVPVLTLGTHLARARELVQGRSRELESVNSLYVVDGKGRLQGVFSVKELLAAQEPKQRVEDVMQTNVVSVRPHTHQERAGLLALQHSLESLPVVDKDGVLLGAVPFASILRILDQEAVEDYLRLGGVYYKGPYDDLLRLSPLQSIVHRLPWLLVGLAGGVVMAGIVSGFEAMLSRHLALAAFIPLVVYMADAVGTQMTAFIIRDLAVNPEFHFLKYFLRQFSVVGPIALIVAASLSAISFLLYGNWLMSAALGIALFFAVLSSLFSGLIVPYAFSKVRLDPANASGPVSTIIQDLLSILVFFFVASRLL